MNSIRRLTITLFLVTWILILVVWLLLHGINARTINEYNDILIRQTAISSVTESSKDAANALDLYVTNADKSFLKEYEDSRERLLEARSSLQGFLNDNNHLPLLDAVNMVESQLEIMEFSVNAFHNNQEVRARNFVEDSKEIASFITDSTSTLIRHELTAYQDFYDAIKVRSSNLKKLSFWSIILVSYMIVLYYFNNSRLIVRPILQLTEEAKFLSRGNFDRPINIQGRDEISYLAQTVNTMRMNLKDLFLRIQEKSKIEIELKNHKLLLKENELKRLQSQIKPHFLFNMLNTVSKRAYLEGAYETCNLVASVSSLLRYNLTNVERITFLKDELDLLEAYLHIQKNRFSDKFTYDLSVDSSLELSEVPSMIVQPFVENIFVHVIESTTEETYFSIEVKDLKSFIGIKISDNGPGIPKAVIKKLEKNEPIYSRELSTESTGIGITNVKQRLDLHYQDDYLLDLQSSEKGTCIYLKLPKRIPGDMNDS